MSVIGLGDVITPSASWHKRPIKILLRWLKSLKVRLKGGERPQKKTSSPSLPSWLSFSIPPFLSPSSLCCLRSTLTAALPLSWPVSFLSFSGFPLSVKAGLSRALRYLCSAAQEKDENSKELSSTTLLCACLWAHKLLFFFSSSSFERCAFLSKWVCCCVLFFHLLVLRCRVENVPGRSAAGCWGCWPALPPSLKAKRADTHGKSELQRQIKMEKCYFPFTAFHVVDLLNN